MRRTGEDCLYPGHLLLQWHVTERCNLRCAHCYQEGYRGEELSFADLVTVLQQYQDLLQHMSNVAGRRVKGHITVTGGEPFVRQDFLQLLEILATNRESFSFAILTNGSFIDGAMSRRLKELKPSFVQVSIEGTKATHDRIRGEGNYLRAVAALKNLAREGIRTLISFTAHRGNFREFPLVARLGRRVGAARIWADRLIPSGRASGMEQQVLSPEETREFFDLMLKARGGKIRRWLSKTEVSMHRALQFLSGGGEPYRCSAGDSLITIQPNGDLYPRRRLPIRAGNVLENPLVDLYRQSSVFMALRDRQKVIEGCAHCFYAMLCGGGLRCLAYAMTGNPFQADPGCWRAKF